MNKNILPVFSAITLGLLCGCATAPSKETSIGLCPVPRSSVMKDKGYLVWGASMVQSDDGIYHLFYCRWKGTLSTWYKGAEIVRATATSPEGPYEKKEVVLGPMKDIDAWDGLSIFNPTVVQFGKKYYLYYSGSNGSNFPIRTKGKSFKKSPKGTLITQRIGVAVADHPTGPWKKMKDPLIDLSEDGIDSHMAL